jgi:hypothetical protein
VSAFSQQEPGQWVGDLYLVNHGLPAEYLLIDEKNAIQSKIPPLSKAPDFPVSANRLNGQYRARQHDGILYTLAFGYNVERNRDGLEILKHTLAKWQDDEWH